MTVVGYYGSSQTTRQVIEYLAAEVKRTSAPSSQIPGRTDGCRGRPWSARVGDDLARHFSGEIEEGTVAVQDGEFDGSGANL
jgi:hypothetical protein